MAVIGSPAQGYANGSTASAAGTGPPGPSTPGSTGVPAFTGRASRGIDRLLRQHGCVLLTAPESFLIGKHNTLLDGEDSRARRWGSALGAAASNAYASTHA